MVLDAIHAAGGNAVAQPADLSDASVIPDLFDRCEAAFGPVGRSCLQSHVLRRRNLRSRPGDRVRDSRSRSSPNLSSMRTSPSTPAPWRCSCVNMSSATWSGARPVDASSTSAPTPPTPTRATSPTQPANTLSNPTPAPPPWNWDPTASLSTTSHPAPCRPATSRRTLNAKIAAGTPLGRVGRPDDIADVIVFLASEQARWLTGQLLYAGGGWRIPQ